MQKAYDIIKKPIITEKSAQKMMDENKYTFEVDYKANKTEIKQAIEEIFDVKVEKVNVINRKAKAKRVGRYLGKTNRLRKAVVTLKEGYSIKVYE